MIHLSKDDWGITIDPKHGAGVLKCQYAGQDILRQTPDGVPFDVGCFPLVPFSNRIENGQFKFEGKKVTLEPNHSRQAHVIHGFGWMSEWTVRSQDDEHVELVFQYAGGDWPWSFELAYRFEVSGSQFSQSIDIKNTGEGPMPAGLGFHPYFPNPETASIRFKTSGMWEGNEEVLPTEWDATRELTDFSKFRNVRERKFDSCFTGWDGRAEIEWADRPFKVIISGSESFDHAILYTPLDRPYFCFEPVTHGNNALANPEVMGKGQSMRVEVGDTLRATMQIDAMKS